MNDTFFRFFKCALVFLKCVSSRRANAATRADAGSCTPGDFRVFISANPVF